MVMTLESAVIHGGDPTPDEGPGPAPQTGPDVRQLAARFGLLAGLAALILVFGLLRPDSFFTIDNLRSTLTISAPLLVLAVGLTVPLSMNEFDLSVSAGTQLWS